MKIRLESLRGLSSLIAFLLVGSVALVSPGCGSDGAGGVINNDPGDDDPIIPVGTLVTGELSLPTSSASQKSGGRVLSAISGGTIEAVDADGNVQGTATTDSNGRYELRLGNGTYQIRVGAGSISYFRPLNTPIIVDSEEVYGAEDVDGVPNVDLEALQGVASVSGFVRQDGNGVASAGIEFVDPDSGEVRFSAVTNANGSFTVDVVPVGNFTVRVDASTLADGLAASAPQNLAVTADGASPTEFNFTVETATGIGGSVVGSDGATIRVRQLGQFEPSTAIVARAVSPIELPPGAEVVIYEIGVGEIARTTIDEDGSYDLDLRDGTYRLEFAGIPADFVAPAPLRITVRDGVVYIEGVDDTLDPEAGEIEVVARTASVSVTGSVTLQTAAIQTTVFARDVTSEGVVASTATDADGNFEINLAAGSFDLFIDTDVLPGGVIPPVPVRVTIVDGIGVETPVREESGTADDGIVEFALSLAVATLTGTVSDDSDNPLQDARILAVRDDERVARGVTDSVGAYSLSLPVGTLKVGVFPESLPRGSLPPDSVLLEVTVDELGVAVITGEDGAITTLDFIAEQRDPNVTGTVLFDFDGDDTAEADEVVGCRIVVMNPDDEEVLFDRPTNPRTGTYDLVLPDGSFMIGVDPEGLPPGTSAPPPQRISVSGDDVTDAEGVVSTSATIDFQLISRAATLTGTITTDGLATSVGLELFDESRGLFVSRTRSDPETGQYRLPVVPGSYDLVLDPNTIPPGVAIPSPVPISVDADGVISTSTGAVTTVNFSLTRDVATLTGTVSVQRGGETFFVDVGILLRDPQSKNIIGFTRSDPETGAYEMKLAGGSWEIALDTSVIPPGVQPPLPETV
ncbi:MAG: carboxypeptidase-like regulatory domain-containing protein, partial [Planctomycetota bacterium]